MNERIVIIGGGLASARVVKSYRESGGDAEVVRHADGAALPPPAALEGLPARRGRA